MGKAIDFLKKSNRWKHLVGGMLLGFVSEDWYGAMLVSAAAGGALEFKDWQHGNLWDWADFSCTFIGGMAGQLLQVLLGRAIVCLS